MTWRFQIRASATIDAGVETIWQRVSDYERTPSWVLGGPTWVRIIRPGESTKAGQGALRQVKFPLWPAVTEEITHFEPPLRFDYVLRAGMPHVAEHLGSLRIEPLEDGRATLHWDIDFGFRAWHPLSWLAPIFVRSFGKIVQRGCDELARQLATAAA